MVGNGVRYFFGSPVLSVVLSKIAFGVDQVHDDSVIHLSGGVGNSKHKDYENSQKMFLGGEN